MNIQDLSPEDASKHLESVKRVRNNTNANTPIDTSEYIPTETSVTPRSGCVDLGIKGVIDRKVSVNFRRV